jgi:hypothetical protein
MCCVLQGKQVSRTSLLQNLVRNTNINLAGIGITLVGLQASVGTLVSKTMLSAANAPYAAPAPGGTLVSLDVFSLQVRDSDAYIGDVTCCSGSWLLGALHNVLCPPCASGAADAASKHLASDTSSLRSLVMPTAKQHTFHCSGCRVVLLPVICVCCRRPPIPCWPTSCQWCLQTASLGC